MDSIRLRTVGLAAFLAVLATAGTLMLVEGQSTQPAAGIRYVAPGGSCGGTPNCYGTVQEAVDAAAPGDEIRVAAGTYTGVSARAGITQAVYISKSVTIRGGFTTSNWTTPDPLANPTTLDAQGAGRVLWAVGTISLTVEGLRITGGNAQGLGGGGPGVDTCGGICAITATVTISACEVFSNVAGTGGGIALALNQATLVGNSIHDNLASVKDGGGLELYHVNGLISSNAIYSNTAGESGGGIHVWSGALTFQGNSVLGNTAPNGGGVFVEEESPGTTFSRNTILSNTAATNGGGLYLYSTNISLSDNVIANNIAGDSCGGATIVYSAPTLINNVISDNQASGEGTGVCVEASSPYFLHTTLARNHGGDGSGISIYDDGVDYSTAILSNTILVSHSVGISVTGGNTLTVDAILWDANTPITVSASVTAVVSLQHEIVGDPAFYLDGYHITADSAAIDRGVNAGVTTDIDGEARPFGPGYDLGADEFVDVPIAGLVASNDSPTLLGQATTLSATVTAGTHVVHSWALGDGTFGSGPVVAHTYPDVGVYTALVTASNSVSQVTATTTVIIQDIPIAGLVAANSSPTLLGDTTWFSATIAAGSHVTYAWSLGDGAYASGANVTHTYSAAGSYSAIVTASNSVSVVTASTGVIVQTCLAQLNDSPIRYLTVQAAVDASTQPGDVVRVSGYCHTVQNHSGYYEQVYLTKALTIRGGYSPDFSTWDPVLYPTTLDAQGQGVGIYLLTGTTMTPTLEALRLTGGAGSLAGGIFASNAGGLVISGCEIYSNTGAYGGGIASQMGGSGRTTLIGNRIHGNQSTYSNSGAGIYLLGGSGSLLYANQLYDHSGQAIYLSNVSSTTLAQNIAYDHAGGAAIHITGSSAVTLFDNTVHDSAQGVYASDSHDIRLTANEIYSSTTSGVNLYNCYTVTLAGNNIHNNGIAGYGDGIVLSYTPGASLTDNQVWDNVPVGIDFAYSPQALLAGNTLSGNGIVCLSSPTSTLAGNTVSGNTRDRGGGVAVYECSDTALTGNTVYSNTASDSGGGIYVASSDNVVLAGNALYGNTALVGGGMEILYGNNVLVSGNRVYRNQAHEGAGIMLSQSAGPVLGNNMVVENRLLGIYGAGISLASMPGATLLHNTFARNTGGAAVYARDGTTAALTNTILVSHTVGIEATADSMVTLVATLWGSGAWANLVDTQGDGIVTGTVNVRGDPAFVAPGSGDYHCGPGSAAIDAGVDAGVRTDVDGQPRPIGAGFDIGADESMASAPISPPAGGTLVYTDSQGLLTTIQVPTGAVTESITLVLAPLSGITTPVGFAFAGHAFVLEAYQGMSLLPGFTFLQPVTITIHYSDADVAGLDEMLLTLEYWDGSGWVDAACGPYDRHPADNWLAVPICHLSHFALLGARHAIYLPLVVKN